MQTISIVNIVSYGHETLSFTFRDNTNESFFILVINQLNAQNLFYNKFISCLYMFRAPRAHRQEVKILLYSVWYHHTYLWPSRAQVCKGRPPIKKHKT